jgi:hypothetical protein
MPDNLPGGPRVQETMNNLKPEDYKIEGNTIFVNWSGQKDENDNPKWEEAFVKNGENWEVRKFVLKREKVDISGMFCADINDYSRTKDGNCIQEDPKDSHKYYIKFKSGDLVWEARRDQAGNILPGSIIYTYAYTRWELGTPEKIIKIALQVDISDGRNAVSFRGIKPAVSISELSEMYPTSKDIMVKFRKSGIPNVNSNSGVPDSVVEYYRELTQYIGEYANFFNNLQISPDLIFYPSGTSTGPIY